MLRHVDRKLALNALENALVVSSNLLHPEFILNRQTTQICLHVFDLLGHCKLSEIVLHLHSSSKAVRYVR